MGIERFRRYTVVGIIATAVHYVVLVALIELTGAWPTWAAMAGAGSGAVTAYLGNRYHTFASQVPHREAFPRFCAVAALGAVTNGVVTWFGTEVLGFHYIVPQVVATAAVWVGGFMLNRNWTFS